MLSSMKQQRKICSFTLRANESKKGVALVLILSFLVIISGLIIAFFSMVTSEASSAGTAAAAASAKSLGDSAVSFVMGTIVDATLGHDPAANDVNNPKGGPGNAWAWTSQPGMIRTFDNTGTPQYVYKLYSADEMRDPAISDPVSTGQSDTTGLNNWATGGSQAVWVDMNEPVKDADGTDVYPIVDPTADENFSTTASGFPGRTDNFPAHRVAGFHVFQQGTSVGKDPNAPSYDANNNNPAPMPVKWLYVLQDGTMVTAKVSGNGAQLNSQAASKTNPIKGRIAFWTDDECAKVNINTASEGTYWDVPRINSRQDAGQLTSPSTPNSPVAIPALAITQPAKGEFQRYPGHPATTSLSEIFGYSGSTTNSNGLAPALPVPTPSFNYSSTDELLIEKYYTLTPRILGGGSMAGRVIPNGTLPPSSGGVIQNPDQGPYWRLYASVDELLFNSLDYTSSQNPNSDKLHRIPNVPSTDGAGHSTDYSAITPDMMQKAKFFITANSSGPEVTLFNTPRVSMWPINDVTHTAPHSQYQPYTNQPMQLTAFDTLAQFCATVGAQPDPSVANPNVYYFNRWNARTPNDDFVSGSRNDVLYQYLQTLTALHIPGNTSNSTKTFLDKYGVGIQPVTVPPTDRDQILTCIFDYIRCTNMQDSTPDPGNPTSSTNAYQYTPVDSIGTNRSISIPGAGEVVPIRINNQHTGGSITQGFGRFDTVGSAYLVIFAAHAQKYTNNLPTDVPPIVPKDVSYHAIPGTSVMPVGAPDALGVVFMISFYGAMEGSVGNHPSTKYSVFGLDNLVFTPGPFRAIDPSNPIQSIPNNQFNGTPKASQTSGVQTGGSVLPNSGTNYIETADVRTWHGRSIGGTCSPVMGFIDGLFTQGWTTTNGVSQAGGTTKTLNYAGQDKGLSAHAYPFYGYTDTLIIPTANQSVYNPKTQYYFPYSLQISQKGGSDIKLEIQPQEVATVTPSTTLPNVGVVQTVHLQFPTALVRMPYAFSDPGNYQDPTVNSTSGHGTSSTSVPGYQTNPIYFFNDRLPYAGGGDGQSGGPFPKGTSNFILPSDTVVALEPAGISPIGQSVYDATAGDQRVYGALPEVLSSHFQPDLLFTKAGVTDLNQPGITDPTKITSDSQLPQFAHNMMRSIGSPDIVYNGVNVPASYGPGAGKLNLGALVQINTPYGRDPDVPSRVGNKTNPGAFVARYDGGPASWDTGSGVQKDGAYLNKPDEGDQNYLNYDAVTGNLQGSRRPYIDKEDYFTNSASFFSPNREIPSSMMLGSIPTGIQKGLPWQTLLFHPAGSDANNPGLAAPADHYIADLFWMPVVEPYAISQPFSTAGKINMNYQIEPFTYIRRGTGMRALMASTKMMAILPNQATLYKPSFADNNYNYTPDSRYPIDLDSTMTVLDQKFYGSTPDVYRSASEIATIPLIPKDTTLGLTGTEPYGTLVSDMNSYWGNGTVNAAGHGTLSSHTLTGNNLRNKPYADLYGRLTTKSNAFTVHVRAQALRKATTTDPTMWIPGKDQVIAEYRGSSIIERYIDANDPQLPDFAADTVANPLNPVLNIDQYYKFRVVSSKRFAP